MTSLARRRPQKIRFQLERLEDRTLPAYAVTSARVVNTGAKYRR